MAAVQGKVTAFIELTKESLDDANDSLDGHYFSSLVTVRRNFVGSYNKDNEALKCEKENSIRQYRYGSQADMGTSS